MTAKGNNVGVVLSIGWILRCGNCSQKLRQMNVIHRLLSSILVWNDMTEYMTEFSFWAYYYVPIHFSFN